MAGNACSIILQTIFFPTEFQGGGANFNDGAWKFGYAPGLTTLAAIFGTSRLASRLFGKWGEVAASVDFGGGEFSFQLSQHVRHFDRGGRVRSSQTRRSILARNFRKKITPAFFAVLLGGGRNFRARVGSGLWRSRRKRLAWESRHKTNTKLQTSGDLNLLQSGRIESLVSMRAISNSPILGHGSWARDVTYVAHASRYFGKQRVRR